MNNANRRNFLLGGASLAAPFLMPHTAIAETLTKDMVRQSRHNISSFKTHIWQDHFDNLRGGAILADITSRALTFWSEDQKMVKLYPTSIPRTEDLTRRGTTRVTRKKDGPTWTPTASMHERFPDLPKVMGPGPDNPLGTHALYLSWPAYLIHGTHDTRKIGRKSSDGCIGLYNFHIAELFELAHVNTQVKLL